MTMTDEPREAQAHVAERLRAQGFTVVLARPGDPVDLVAWDGDTTRFIRLGETRGEALAADDALHGMTWPPHSEIEVWWGEGKTWHHRVLHSITR